MLTELGCHSGSETCSGQSAAADDDLSNVPIAGGGASWTAGGAADAGSGHAGRSARILLSALRKRRERSKEKPLLTNKNTKALCLSLFLIEVICSFSSQTHCETNSHQQFVWFVSSTHKTRTDSTEPCSKGRLEAC